MIGIHDFGCEGRDTEYYPTSHVSTYILGGVDWWVSCCFQILITVTVPSGHETWQWTIPHLGGS